MTLHLLKLVWHRKRSLALVAAEICCSFLIVFAVVTLAASLLSRWRTPLGFDWTDVWVAEVEPTLQQEHSGTRTTGPSPEEKARQASAGSQMDQVVREARSLAPVEAAAIDFMAPYSDNSWMTAVNPGGRSVMITADQAGDDFAKVMRIKLLRGRWFGPEDDAANYTPIVIDTTAAKAMFGDADPVGQRIAGDARTDERKGEMRVVGLISPYRKDGEFSANDMNIVFFRVSPGNPFVPAATRLVIRVRPGTPAAFESLLDRRLHEVAPNASIRIQRLSDMRRSAIQMRMVPIVALSLVAVFLISMVMLGLTGVLWQTVTRRTREIGLRRALGASGGAVRRQVLAEVAILATLAIAVGAALVAQLPLLGVFRLVSAGELTAGFAVSLLVIYAITLLCGAYPSWLASRIDPGEALRYE